LKSRQFFYGTSFVGKNKTVNRQHDYPTNNKKGQFMKSEPETVSPATIAEKNDQLRQTAPHLRLPHRFVLSDEIAALPKDQLEWIIYKVKMFSDFNEKNDPHSERDFGELELQGQKIFWKFDYYDQHLKYFEENGIRILTVMFAYEY
jgi:hypothetical protein